MMDEFLKDPAVRKEYKKLAFKYFLIRRWLRLKRWFNG